MKCITLFFQSIYALLFPFSRTKVRPTLATENTESCFRQIRSVSKRSIGVNTQQVPRTVNSFFTDSEIIAVPKVQVAGSNRKPASNGNTANGKVKLPESKKSKNGFSITKAYGSQGFDKVVPWLVKHLIPASSNGVLFGQSQSYKTFVLIYIACCIATNRLFSGLPTKHGLVFIIAAEGSNGISKRIRAWELQNGCTVGEKLIVIPHSVFPSDTNQRNCLINEIETESKRQATPVVLIIFDTFSQCSNGILENEAGAVSRYLQSCKSIGEPFGATVLNVHHTKKDSNEFRGSSTIISNVDFLFSMKRHRDKMSTKLALEKMKEGSTNLQWDLHLDCIEIDASDEEGESLNTLCITQVEFHHLDEAAQNNHEVKKLQYKVDAEWIRGHLKQYQDTWMTLNELGHAMAEELCIPVDAALKVRLDRAKSHLEKEKIISKQRKGKEVCICLTDS
ncbi:AAA family ATPase [Alteromonas sp. C1M14]|uniref:AAA family ATPase n=1 Tax=Alteromonas sp. C1M14 TaxID=2841567 RepID=UPI001C094A3E|nr:AAA family ATPase [Alteromonas sp. C1M14]MBU2979731.1 helicase RepA family protein [Alteromonas sp. C1M14]